MILPWICIGITIAVLLGMLIGIIKFWSDIPWFSIPLLLIVSINLIIATLPFIRAVL